MRNAMKQFGGASLFLDRNDINTDEIIPAKYLTEVTKEAATLVLTDDNFASIVRAVEEGRTIYDNIVKFVRFQLSTNIGAILTVLGAPLLGFATPFGNCFGTNDQKEGMAAFLEKRPAKFTNS